MSGCYPYSYCACPCHNGLIMNEDIRCGCECYFNKDKNVSPIVEKIQELEKLLNDFIKSANTRLEVLHNHKNYQIEENRKISKRVDELEEIIKRISEDDMRASKIPHKCPICEGYGSKLITERTSVAPADHYRKQNPCISCEGKGIVWG